jgi:hypothetical protein
MVGRFLRRLVLLMAALGVATALLVGGMAMLAPAARATASPVLQRDQAGAVERGVAREGEQRASDRSSPMPVVVLVFAGILLLATLPPASRVSVYYHRPPGSHWQ